MKTTNPYLQAKIKINI